MLRKVTYILLKFLAAKMDQIDVVSYNVTAYRNITTALNEDLLHTPLPR
jgi:hypothetical protein